MSSGRQKRVWIGAGLLGVGFFITAALTVFLTRFDGGVAFIWVSTALLLGWLIVTPEEQHWRGLMACGVASLLVTTCVGYGAAAAPFFVPANVGEAVVAWALLQKMSADRRHLDTMRGVRSFIIVSCAAPAFTGVLAAIIIYVANGHSVATSYEGWVTGHALGTLAFTPIVVLMMQGEGRPWNTDHKRSSVETLALLAGVTGSAAYVFWQTAMPLLFFPMLPMMLATIRLGRFGAAVSTALVTAIGGFLTLRGHGPVHLMQGTDGNRAQFFQFYIATGTLLVLPVAALLKQYQELLIQFSASEARQELIALHASDAILNIGVDGTIHYASPSFQTLGGFDPADLVGRNAGDMIFEPDAGTMEAAHRQALSDPARSFSAEYRAETADGVLRWFENKSRAVMGDGGRVAGFVCSIRDITDRKAAELQLLEHANTDALTGLHNRRAFMDMLELRASALSAEGADCCVVMFDIDHFKRFNDTHGHAAGDLVLKAFAASARTALRDADMLARIGGEEFALLLWNADVDTAAAVAERVREAVARATVRATDGSQLCITVSAGVAQLSSLDDAHAALQAADEALYRAKTAGRNCLRLAA